MKINSAIIEVLTFQVSIADFYNNYRTVIFFVNDDQNLVSSVIKLEYNF